MIWNLMGSIGGKVLDFMDIDEADRFKFLIEIKFGDIVECGDGTNVISITASRQDTMNDERWNQLKTRFFQRKGRYEDNNTT